ncbi:MAG: hypothetical protein QM692_04495 [Thermomicrobiales bacterium]
MRSESEPSPAATFATTSDDMALQGVPTAADLISAQEARREKRARRKNLRLVDPNGEPVEAAEGAEPATAEAPAVPVEVAPTQKMIDAEMRRMSRETRQHPDESRSAARAARTEAADAADDTDAVTGDAEVEAGQAVALVAVEAAPLVEPVDGKNQRPGKTVRKRANTADRARRKNSVAAAEQSQILVRQLSVTTQQLNAAHRVIGRLSAERDILRQHFADAVGIPVNEVVVATETDPTSDEHHKKTHVEAKAPTRMEKLNYFGGSDYAQMRRRRQTFVGILLAFVLVLWALSRAGYWAMPDNLSRDSLGQVPLIGDLMTYFLAGWLFFRVAKVSSKGVRWVFPSDNRQRRRR